MFPYSTSRDEINEDIENKEEIMNLTTQMTSKIKEAYGAIYEPGQAREVLYEAGGMTIDYSYKELNIPYSWVYELRDTGDYGIVSI